MPAAARRDLARQTRDADVDLAVLAVGWLGLRVCDALGEETLGAGVEAVSLGVTDWPADWDAELLGDTESLADADSLGDLDADVDALGDVVSEAEALVDGDDDWSSVANAAGADISASGAMAAVAATAVRARRNFMKTSKIRCAATLRHMLGEASACGARVVAVDSVGVTRGACERLRGVHTAFM
ncbi:hypothetical protein ACFQ0G_22115 [Streptomyces chiangmaiensis]